MKQTIIFAALIMVTAFSACTEMSQENSLSSVKQKYLAGIDSLSATTAALSNLNVADSASMREYFLKARISFKKIEFLGEFYDHDLMTLLNGPAIQKQNLHDNIRVRLPVTGFQKVEELLFPGITEDTLELKQELKRLHGLVSSWKDASRIIVLNKTNVFEAMKKQYIRIASLGISGFDSPVALNSLPEAASALEGLTSFIQLLVKTDTPEFDDFQKTAETAVAFLQKNKDFEEFDRWTFVRDHLTPAYNKLLILQEGEEIRNNKWVSAIRWDKELFSDGYINPDHFAPSYNRKNTLEQSAFGELLFNDVRLSANNQVSCATCHQPDKAFTDGKARSLTVQGDSLSLRNAPTLVNSGYQMAQFHDSRVVFLEEQVKDVISNPLEMHGSFDSVIERINSHGDYKEEVYALYGDSLLTGRRMQMAIAAYVRSLDGLDSKFDLALRREAELSDSEAEGFNLFMGKAKCGTCHFFPLFNGTVPPDYKESESEVLGVPEKYVTEGAIVDPDSGKYHVFLAETHLFAFKTPGVRNAALTAPYMHNGALTTLKEVMDFYNRGGGAGIGINLPNQTLPPDPLNLTAEEQEKIIMFIETLNSGSGQENVARLTGNSQ